jgi:ribosomal protein S18 acetylase RimI-like enzyme
MNVIISRATTLEEVRQCAVLYPEYAQTDSYIGSPEYEYDHVQQGSRVVLYAKLGSEVIGVVQLLVITNPPAKLFEEGASLLQRLRVKPAFRRQGIGELLSKEAEHVSLQYGLQAIYLIVEPDNEPAKELYQKLCFHFVTNITNRLNKTFLAYKKEL